jgi:predicted Zn finger-like uncharacterized protein
MNVRCPNCQTVFRVDPNRVPPAGVRARCARCSATFRVTRDAGAVQPAPAAATPSAVAPDRTRSEMPAPAAERMQEPPPRAAETPSAPIAAPQAEPPAPMPAAPPVASPVAAPTPVPPAPVPPIAAAASVAPPQAVPSPAPPQQQPGAGSPPRPPVFGSRDPNARAQRIARALVSDIVAYHPKRRDASLAAGTLRTDFREEIMKSWEEYVAQVGLDLAKSTPYFRNSLNEILAGGQQIF